MSLVYLGHTDWGTLAAKAANAQFAELNLEAVRVAYPPGSVALLLLARYRELMGCSTRIRCPQNTDVLNYLERIDFFHKAGAGVDFDADLPALAKHRRFPSTRFTELLTPSDEGFEEVQNVLYDFVRQNARQQANALYAAVDEILRNVSDHSAPGNNAAFSCAQIQVYKNAVELAVGDLGVGFLGSLNRNPLLPKLASDRDALEGAMIEKYSRLGDRERGGGLRFAADAVQKSGGSMRVQSYCGFAYTVRDGIRFQQHATAFPGTILSVRVPRA